MTDFCVDRLRLAVALTTENTYMSVSENSAPKGGWVALASFVLTHGKTEMKKSLDQDDGLAADETKTFDRAECCVLKSCPPENLKYEQENQLNIACSVT